MAHQSTGRRGDRCVVARQRVTIPKRQLIRAGHVEPRAMRRRSQMRRLLGEPLEGGGVAPLEDVDNGIEPLVELAVEVVRDRESRARTGLLPLTQSTQSCTGSSLGQPIPVSACNRLDSAERLAQQAPDTHAGDRRVAA